MNESLNVNGRAGNPPSSFALIDLKIDNKNANRDHTGGFGSYMEATGLFGQLVSKMKSHFIQLPIMSFGFCSSLLKSKGYECNFYENGNIKGEDIIIIASSMHCYEYEVKLAKELKERFVNSKVGFYGPFSITNPEFFNETADFIIGGELESSLLAFFDDEHEFSGILNYGIVKDFDSLPPPDWSGMPLHNYSYFPMLGKKPFLPIQSTRGCSFNCDFCPYMVSQTKIFRRRSPENVVDEIERNITHYKTKSVLFRDICFTLNKKHSAAICREIIARDISIEWGCETRLDCLDTELIDLMCEAGMKGMNIGIEAASNEILKISGKKNPEIEVQERIVSYLLEKGVHINAFYMLGLEDDTPDSMNDTINYAKRLGTPGAQFCVTTPFPGTKTYEKMQSKLITKDFRRFTEYKPVMEIKGSTINEIEKIHGKAYRSFYLNWKWLSTYGPSFAKKLLTNII